MVDPKKKSDNILNLPEEASSVYNIALAALKEKDYKLAINKFQQVRQMIYCNLGQAYALDGQYENSFELFDTALKLDPDPETRAFIYANRGYVYTQKKWYGFAINEYKKALKIKPKDIKSKYTLALLYENRFQMDLALQEIEQVIKLDPNNAEYRKVLKRIKETPPLIITVGKRVKPLKTLGLIVVPTYVPNTKSNLPMVIYVYPESPILNKVKVGDIINKVTISNSQPVEEKKDNEDINMFILLDSNPQTQVQFMVGEEKIDVICSNEITRKLPEQERLNVYKNWLNSFDSRLTWLWQQPEDIRNEVGQKWGEEFESLARDLQNFFADNPIAEAVNIIMLEYLQIFITQEEDTPKELIHKINLGLKRISHKIPDMVTFFKDLGLIKFSEFIKDLPESS